MKVVPRVAYAVSASHGLIWVVNRSTARNMGDRLLSKSLGDLVKARGYGVRTYEFIGSSGERPGNLAGWALKRVAGTGVWRFFSVLRYISIMRKHSPDVILVGGGQLLLPNRYFLFCMAAWVGLSKLSGSSLVLFAVGTEEKYGEFSVLKRALLRYSIRSAACVRVRDTYSQRLIRTYSGRKPSVIPDVAYGLDVSAFQKQKKEHVYVCPSSFKRIAGYGKYNNRREYFEVFWSQISRKRHVDERVILFSTSDEDHGELDEFHAYIGEQYPEVRVVVFKADSEEELLRELGGARVVIGARMHALIIGHLFGADVHPVCVNNKLAAWAEEWLPHPTPEIRKLLEREVESALKGFVYNWKGNNET